MSKEDHEESLAANLPPQESHQPDPILQLSVGRLGAGSITLVAVVAAVILAVVFYGLNSPAPDAQSVGAPKSASSAPQGGGHSPTSTPGAQHGNSGHS
jgi:hypothetical protein